MIAQGNKLAGSKDLQEYINSMKLKIEQERKETRVVNLKMQSNLKNAEKVQ